MHFESLLLGTLLAVLIFAGIASFLRRRRSPDATHSRRSRFGFFRGAGLGNALVQLQVIVNPQTRHLIVQMADEETDADDSGDPADPVAHLHRQAEKIRRGEEIDHITALLAKGE